MVFPSACTIGIRNSDLPPICCSDQHEYPETYLGIKKQHHESEKFGCVGVAFPDMQTILNHRCGDVAKWGRHQIYHTYPLSTSWDHENKKLFRSIFPNKTKMCDMGVFKKFFRENPDRFVMLDQGDLFHIVQFLLLVICSDSKASTHINPYPTNKYSFPLSAGCRTKPYQLDASCFWDI